MSLVSPTQALMAKLLAASLDEQGVTQVELAQQAGVSTKHLNRVLNEKARATQGQLDYWAWLLGLRFEVTLVEIKD